MNKKRSQFIYRLVGTIDKKTKCYSQKGASQTTHYWRLAVKIEDKPAIQSIKVFANSLENQAVWKALESNQHLDKKYLFSCRNSKGHYYLITWQELSNNHDYQG